MVLSITCLQHSLHQTIPLFDYQNILTFVWVYFRCAWKEMILTTTVAANSIALHLLKLLLQRLDRRVCALQILVQAITLTNELLLPLSESVFLNLDLLRESLSEILFLFLELGVVELSGSSLAKLAGLHLLGAVGFVVGFFGSVDEVEHVGSNENRAQLLKITVVFVLNFCNAPRVLTTLDDAPIACLNILLRANDGKWHGGHQASCVLCRGFIIFLNGGSVDLDTLCLDDSSNLCAISFRCVGGHFLLNVLFACSGLNQQG
jgi:hypothetical protein